MNLPAIDNMDVWAGARNIKKASGRGQTSDKLNVGMNCLRSLVLKLAVTGKLTKQHESDGAGTQLFIEIKEERKNSNLNKARAKQLKSPPAISIPKNWVTIPLTESYSLISVGKNKIKNKEIKEFGEHPVVDQGQSFVAGYSDDTSKVIEIPSPVVIFGDHTKNVKMVDFNFIAGADGVKILRPIKINPKFFFFQLQSIDLETKGYSRYFTYLNNNHFFLPPLKEQKRIVAKVDELMGLIDDFEAQTETACESHAELVDAFLRTLVKSEDANVLTQNWTTLSTHFDTLFTTETSVEKLKAAILDLAVRGILVEPFDDAQDAQLLLKELSKVRKVKEKSREVRKAKYRELKQPFPHAIPKTWAWASFPQLGVFERGKSKHRPRNAPILFNPGKYPLVQTGEIARAGYYVTEVHSYYSEAGLKQSRLWPAGTLCITIAANIADSAILKFDACFPDSVVGFIPFKPINNPKYFLYFITTAKQNLLKYAPSTAQKNINLGILEDVAIPLPPLEEQERIVAKVDELLALCDDLLAYIRKSESLKVELADSTVHHASSS